MSTSQRERRKGPWTIHICEDHGVQDCAICGVFDVVRVVAASHLLDVVRAKADIVSALDSAILSMAHARACLTPGMQAGVAEAAAKLDEAIREAQSAR